MDLCNLPFVIYGRIILRAHPWHALRSCVSQSKVLLLKNEIILLWLDELVDDSANDGVQQTLHRFSTPGIINAIR